ncbi:hypothetical protein BKA69DRAFT_1094648 [Paraphysoderma sedebokerense]|nr:hypothetical protein BKA69DRAFT_1094648 [Paraphysoderma sedebokerense]
MLRCRGHRAHHRYTDTDQDPYSAQKGLWHCHIGWLILRSDQGYLRKIDISDLLSDPMVRWQHRYYIYLAAFMGFVFPSIVAGLGWGDYRGGFYIAGVARLVFLHHATFCVNSLAHYLGEATYDDNRSPRDHFITALITFGEGYHNFHHEFPQDYRNGIKFYHYDPTKWLIQLCSYFGFTYNLLEFSSNEIEKGRLQMQQRKIDGQMHRLDWGVPIEKLPQWTIEDFRKQCHRTPNLLIIDRMVYDVSKFIETHPGGPGYLKSNSGKDVTHMYNGGVYNHSNAARNLMAKFRIAVIKKGEDQLKGEKEE